MIRIEPQRKNHKERRKRKRVFKILFLKLENELKVVYKDLNYKFYIELRPKKELKQGRERELKKSRSRMEK